jgi:hypothetical protein
MPVTQFSIDGVLALLYFFLVFYLLTQCTHRSHTRIRSAAEVGAGQQLHHPLQI